MDLIPGVPEGQYATLPNGQTIHYLDYGKGPVVVFLHGSGSGASGYSNFKGNYPVLVQAGWRVIVLDNIGYGYSDKPIDIEYHLDFFAECVEQTLDALGVKKYSLVGNSLGGAIAIRLALDFPERIEKIVLMAPGGIENQLDYFYMPGMKMVKDAFMSSESITEKQLSELIENAFVYNNDCLDDQLIRERWVSMQSQHPHVLKTMVVPNMAESLKDIQCPILAFWGLNEKIMPETGIMTLARQCNNIRMILLSECGHWVMLEYKKLFNRMVVDFFENGNE